MEGSGLANPLAARRQVSGADTALSNAVTSVTVSQQESEGQASEPAAGSTGEPPSPRAARSQVSTAVSFEGARAAGSAVQPERSVDEDSALSAAEPDGPVRSNRLQHGPRPANSLISTAVHPTFRHGNNGNKYNQLALPPQQQHAQVAQQHHVVPAALKNEAPYGRGAGPTNDHYASSPEVQRPHSITSHAAETRGEGPGHGGRGGVQQGHGPFHSPRAHPAQSNVRGATPASVYGQLHAPGHHLAGPPSPRKPNQRSPHWAAPPGDGGANAAMLDPATAAAAAAAALLGNGLVGGWGLVPGLAGRGANSMSVAGHGAHHNPAALQQSLLAAAAAAAGPSGSAGPQELQLAAPHFNLAALGQLQLRAASMHQRQQQQAAAASASALAAVGDAAAAGGLNPAAAQGLLWHAGEHRPGASGPGQQPHAQSQQQPSQLQSKSQQGGNAAPQHPPILPPPQLQQATQPLPQFPPLAAAASVDGGLVGSSAHGAVAGGVQGGGELGAAWHGGTEGGATGGGDVAAGDAGPSQSAKAAADVGKDGRSRRGAHAGNGSPYRLSAAILGAAFSGNRVGHAAQYAVADMHGLQGLLSASMNAVAAAAVGSGRGAGAGGCGEAGGGIPASAQTRNKAENSVTHAVHQPQQQSQQRSGMNAPLGAHAAASQPPQVLLNPQNPPLQPPGFMQQQLGAHGHGQAPHALTEAASPSGMPPGGAGTPCDTAAAAALHTTAGGTMGATATATSTCGTVNSGGGGGGGVGTPGDGGGGHSAPPVLGGPPMHLYLPMMLPFDLVNAQMALSQAAAAAAAAAAGPTTGAVPAAIGLAVDGAGAAGPSAQGAAAAPAAAVASMQALNASQQRFLLSAHESAHQGVAGVSAGDGGAGARPHHITASTAAAASVARGVGMGGGVNADASTGGAAGASHAPGMMASPSSSQGPPAQEETVGLHREMAADAGDVMLAGRSGGAAMSQHSARSNSGARGGATVAASPMGVGQAAVAPAVSAMDTATASVAAAGGGGGNLPAAEEVVQQPSDGGGNGVGGGGSGSAGIGAMPAGDPGAALAAGAGAAAAAGAFGGMGGLPGHNPNPLAHHHHHNNNNLTNNVHSNAYGAGPSMTHTADYRSHLQVALSLLLQATSATYNSQRQSGIAGGNEGSGIFAAPGQQASASEAMEQELSGVGGVGMAGGEGVGNAAGAGGCGVVSSGVGGMAGSGAGPGIGLGGGGSPVRSGAGAGGAGGGAAAAEHAGGGGAAGVVGTTGAQSMHGVVIGPAAAAAMEPMDTEGGQVVDQAVAGSRDDMEASPGAPGVRQMGANPALEAAGGCGGDSPAAYQAPQWSTQRGGGGGGGGGGAAAGGGARSAMYGSSGAAEQAGRGSTGVGVGGHPPQHHAQPVHHSHHHHHHPMGHPHGYHHRRGSGAAGDSGNGGANAGTEGGCSPGVAQLAGELLLPGRGGGAGTGGGAGASVGSAGGAAAGDGEQADNNSALQQDADAGHPAASVHATVIAEGSDVSGEAGGGEDSGSIEVPPAAARGLDGAGAGAGMGGGGGVGSSKAAAAAVLGEIISQRFEGSRSRSREGQASKQQLEGGPLLQGQPAAGTGLGVVGSHHAEARSPVRHAVATDPRDSSMGMAAGPSHDGTGSGSNGATTSDTVDMAEDDSRMGSASEHADSGMGDDPPDLMLTDENLLALDEHGGENGGAVGGGGDDVEERGDDNDNAGSADGDGGEGGDGADGDGDGFIDGDAGARTSVGPAAALLGMLGGGGGGASTGHMNPVSGGSAGKAESPKDKAASHYPTGNPPDHPRHHGHHPHHHSGQPEPFSAVGNGGAVAGGGGAGGSAAAAAAAVAHASNSATARHNHPLQQHQQQQLQLFHQHSAVASIYGAAAAAAAAASGGDVGGTAPAASGAGGADDAAGLQIRGSVAPGGLSERLDGLDPLPDRGSPAPQQTRLQAANSTAMSPMVYAQVSPRGAAADREEAAERRGAGGAGAGASTHGGFHAHREERRVAVAGAGPAFSASNADRVMTGEPAAEGAAEGHPMSQESLDAAANKERTGGAAAAAATAADSVAAAVQGQTAAAGPAPVDTVGMKSSSQEAAGSVRHRLSPYDDPGAVDPGPSKVLVYSHVQHPQQHRMTAGAESLQIRPHVHHPHFHQHPQQGQQHSPQHGHVPGTAAVSSLSGQAAASPHGHAQRQVATPFSGAATATAHRRQGGGADADVGKEYNNTTLAALGLPARHPASVLTTASQPPPQSLQQLPEGQHAFILGMQGAAAADEADAAAAAADAEAEAEAGPQPAETNHLTHGSGACGQAFFGGNRASQDAVPQVTEIHGTFPGMAAATAAEALALRHQEDMLAAAAAAGAVAAAAGAGGSGAAAAPDAQGSWQADPDRVQSGSPGGPSLSAVMPQFTEVHGAFMRTAGRAAEAQAGALRVGIVGGEGSGGGTGVEPGAAAGPLTAAGGVADGAGAGPDGKAACAVGSTGGAAGEVYRQAAAHGPAGPPVAGGALWDPVLRLHGPTAHAVETAAAASGAGADDAAHIQQRLVAGTAAGGGGAGGSSNAKAQSALHPVPMAALHGRGGGGGGGGGGAGGTGPPVRSSRTRAVHDGALEVVGHHRGGDTTPRSFGRHGSNGVARPQHGAAAGVYVGAAATISQSGEAMAPPGGDYAQAHAAAGAAAAATASIAEADVAPDAAQDSLYGRNAAHHHDVGGPARSGADSGGGVGAEMGAEVEGSRRKKGEPAASAHAPASKSQHSPALLPAAAPPQHLHVHPQQASAGGGGSGAGGPKVTGGAGVGEDAEDSGRRQRTSHHAQTTAAQAPLSTQADAYGGYDDDDEFDSDGVRRRAEGPPQPQMTILVTSHAANSHHTVSGGTAVVSEADNGGTVGATAGGGAGRARGSPAVAAWEEEFDGPHRPTAREALQHQQEGSWRGVDGAGCLANGPVASAVMSSGRVDDGQAVNQQPAHAVEQEQTAGHRDSWDAPPHQQPQTPHHVSAGPRLKRTAAAAAATDAGAGDAEGVGPDGGAGAGDETGAAMVVDESDPGAGAHRGGPGPSHAEVGQALQGLEAAAAVGARAAAVGSSGGPGGLQGGSGYAAGGGGRRGGRSKARIRGEKRKRAQDAATGGSSGGGGGGPGGGHDRGEPTYAGESEGGKRRVVGSSGAGAQS